MLDRGFSPKRRIFERRVHYLRTADNKHVFLIKNLCLAADSEARESALAEMTLQIIRLRIGIKKKAR